MRTTLFADAVERLGGAEEELAAADGGGGAVVGGVAVDAVTGDEFELGAEFEDDDFATAGDLAEVAV